MVVKLCHKGITIRMQVARLALVSEFKWPELRMKPLKQEWYQEAHPLKGQVTEGPRHQGPWLIAEI